MELIINDTPLDLCETDALLEAVTLLQATLADRAESDLCELDAKRERLLAFLPCPVQSASEPVAVKKSNGRNGKSAGEPKYRDPDTGKTWGGRGRRPGWFDEDRVEEFRLAA